VSAIAIIDGGAVSRNVAARNLGGGGTFYQMTEPEVLTHHRVAAGLGDAVSILGVPGVLRAVRVFNNGSVTAFAKFHDTAVPPTAGIGVVYAVACQAGLANPDPRLSGGGRAFAAGLGMTIVTGLADNSAAGVIAGSVLVEVEYHAA
jgi:hypothetical protein